MEVRVLPAALMNHNFVVEYKTDAWTTYKCNTCGILSYKPVYSYHIAARNDVYYEYWFSPSKYRIVHLTCDEYMIKDIIE